MLLSMAHILPGTLGPQIHQVLPATHQLFTAVRNAMGATEQILQTTEGQWAIAFNTSLCQMTKQLPRLGD